MPISIGQPVLDADGKTYGFEIEGAPMFTHQSRTQLALPFDHPEIRAPYEAFLTDFLHQASEYFSRALPLPLFLERVKHIWRRDEIMDQGELTGGRLYTITWIPAMIWFRTPSYEIHWSLCQFEPGSTEAVAATTLAAPPVSEPPPLPLAPAPPSENPKGPRRSREDLKRKVRQARLRAAIAQLRAERLAEQFYIRYGTVDLEESDSDLSFEADLDQPGKI